MCELENAAIVKKTLVDASTEICGVSAINEDVNNIWQGSYLNPNIGKRTKNFIFKKIFKLLIGCISIN